MIRFIISSNFQIPSELPYFSNFFLHYLRKCHCLVQNGISIVFNTLHELWIDAQTDLENLCLAII